MSTLSNQMVLRDTLAMIEWVESAPHANASRIGSAVYCMSGPFALCGAAAYPERVRATASIYGIRLFVETNDSTHLGFDDTVGEIYIACAEYDDYVPIQMVDSVKTEIKRSGANGRVELYHGVDHRFAFPGRGNIYNKDAAERH